MALFHYPNQLLESGEKGFWLTPILEVAVTTLQPALFALGTVYWPVKAMSFREGNCQLGICVAVTWKASFWGNSTLGCYVIHFLFRDRMTEVIQMMIPMLSWDVTGLLLPLAIIDLAKRKTKQSSQKALRDTPSLVIPWVPQLAGLGNSAGFCVRRAAMNIGAMDGWPFPSDFRDPNEAWDVQGKLVFFALYTGFWACMVLAVFLYTRLRSHCSCRRRVRSPVKRQSSGFADVSKMSEAFGEMPPFPESKVHELFLEQAKLTPTATALVLPHEAKTVVTYQELAEAVRQLAVVLEQLGANGEIVALSLPRSSAQVVSILGALLAGAGYLPMDDTGPEARKRLVLEDSRAKVLISDANSQECKQL
ncbi:bacC, partial [Symbiodinium sp. CCMP2456]